MHIHCIFNALRHRKAPNKEIGGLVTSLMFETTRQELAYKYKSIFSLEIEFIAADDLPETCWSEVNHATIHSN